MKNTGKVGNKPGQPKFRTAADFRGRKSLDNQAAWTVKNNFKSRPTKIFNRGK